MRRIRLIETMTERLEPLQLSIEVFDDGERVFALVEPIGPFTASHDTRQRMLEEALAVPQQRRLPLA